MTRPRIGALAVAVLVAVGACGGDDLPESTPVCDLGRGNDQNVVGHDLAASTELPDGRVLFVFGDTLLGTIKGDTRTATGLLNSSGAVIPADEDICSDRIHYLTDTDAEPDANPRALLPDPPREDTAYWPVDVAVDGDQVWMLYRWVERSGPGPLAIRVLGSGLAVADVEDLAFAPAEDLLVEGDAPLPSALHTLDGEVIVLVCSGEEDDRDCQLSDLDTEATAIGPPRPVPEVGGAASEMSLAQVDVGAREIWRVSSMPQLRCRLRMASLVEGEWEAETVLAPDPSGEGICYAGRVQEPYSDADDLIATWVDNPEERSDADQYWPHVVRIDLSEG